MKQHFISKLVTPLVLLLAALLRFYNLSGQSLWADEGNSVALARRNFSEIAQRTAFDIHPPLYYWLLKIWVSIFGETEAGLRSLSAVLGIGLVYLVWSIGSYFFNRRVGLVAAFIATLSPLQVYYAQETRMYMLLAFLGGLTIWIGLLIFEGRRNKKLLGLFYVATVTAGFYTHYAYPIIFIAINLVAFIHLLPQKNLPTIPTSFFGHRITNYQLLITNLQSPISWLMLQLIPLLLYLPWLPIAWRQITTWPSEQQPAPLSVILTEISTSLLFGLSWPNHLDNLALAGLGVFIALGILSQVLDFLFKLSRNGYYAPHTAHYALRITHYVLLWLWLLLPILLTIFIFSPAFLKFLVVAAPALALLGAITLELLLKLFHRRWPGYMLGGVLLAGLITGSCLSLHYYFTDAAYARDDYRSIVQFIKAVGGASDVVVLHAEGQQDVFNYYYGQDIATEPSVHPLPRQRPLNEKATLAELAEIARTANKVYGVYWATQQADPNGLIEGWLDRQLFKATDQWYGNVRLVNYASPQAGVDLRLTPVDYQFGNDIRLSGYALSSSELAAGDILQVALQWKIKTPLVTNYVVFLQLLDQQDHLVGQRDAPPTSPTSSWPLHQPIADWHGIFIDPGTPPGKHRLIVGLYQPDTGRRLPVGSGDFATLSEVKVTRPATPLPAGAFNIQVPLNVSMLDLTLLGYDLYKLGYRSPPDTPLHSGDPVQLVAYWRLDQPGNRVADQLFIQVVANDGAETPLRLRQSLTGVDYPVATWQAGEIVRAQYNFFLTGLKPGGYHLILGLESKNAGQRAEIVTGAFQIVER